MAPSGSGRSSGGAGAPQTRHRKITACLRCRDRKKKCDRQTPVCQNCDKENEECIYASDGQKLREHKQKLHSLNRSFAKAASKDHPQDDPEINPLIVADPAYEDDVDDDAADVGVKCGKLRISDRIGGMVRPKLVDELNNLLKASSLKTPGLAFQMPGYSGNGAKHQDHLPTLDFLLPGPSYLAPSSNVFWSTENNPNAYLLPVDRSQAEELLDVYWTNVHPVARVLHRPSFGDRWQTYWNSVYNQQSAPKSLHAIVTAVLFSAAISLAPSQSVQNLATPKEELIETLKTTTEAALSRADWIRSSKIETLQAVVIYLIPLCRSEVSRAHSNIVAAMIRAAESLGLHVDGSTRGFSPLQTHARRLLWYQLSLLDIRTSEATGPRPYVRDDDFTTNLPTNLDDIHMDSGAGDSAKWTEMTLTIIRCECNEFIRRVWGLRAKLQRKMISITEVLLEIQQFYNHMEHKIADWRTEGQYSDVQSYGELLYKIQILRTFAMILHQYHLHPKVEMSDRLKHVFIVKGIDTMDAIKALETDSHFEKWNWLAGALQQHHYALALLLELLLNPQRKDAPRIQQGLDYVFEPPTDLSPLERVRWTVTTIRDRVKVYMDAKKLRAPVSLMEQLRLGRHMSEPSEGSSSAEAYASSEGTRPNQALSQTSDANDDLNTSYTGNDSRLSSEPVRHNPSQARGSSQVEATPPRAQVRSGASDAAQNKDVMDLDWTQVSDSFSAIGPDLDMSSEQFNSALMTGAYPSQISQYNQMPLDTSQSLGYNYYSSTFPSTMQPGASPIIPSTSRSAQASHSPHHRQLHQQQQSQYYPPQSIDRTLPPSSSPDASTGPFLSQQMAPTFQTVNPFVPTQRHMSNAYSGAPTVGSSSATQPSMQAAAAVVSAGGGGYPPQQQQSDNEANFGMGMYLPVNTAGRRM